MVNIPRQPESGLLLLEGLDGATLGDTWRRISTSAPQFHENYVFTGTFAFNLLMGRSWPPDGADLATAEQVCRELGLGNLLDRMPSGLMQMVGWQLSHGERSRLYLARALLQGTELVVLDESLVTHSVISTSAGLVLTDERLRGAPQIAALSRLPAGSGSRWMRKLWLWPADRRNILMAYRLKLLIPFLLVGWRRLTWTLRVRITSIFAFIRECTRTW